MLLFPLLDALIDVLLDHFIPFLGLFDVLLFFFIKGQILLVGVVCLQHFYALRFLQSGILLVYLGQDMGLLFPDHLLDSYRRFSQIRDI